MQHVTIKDVAKALGVSVSAVSKAFNDKYDIKEETRLKILKVAEEMGYSPNPIARKLTQKCSYNIGVVVPEFLNSFFPKVILGIQEVLHDKGYQVLIMQCNEDSERELKNLKTLVNNFVDGIILSLTQESENIEYLQSLVDKETPIVLFNRVSNALNVPKVVFDDYKWAFFATEHLIQQGLTKLINLSGPSHLSLSKNRVRGFVDAHRKYKLDVPKENIIETNFLLESGEHIVESLIQKDKLPQGFVCVNDPTAKGCIRMLKKYGYKIPEDVAVIGFTETPSSSLIDPPLSSVEQPAVQMGQVAAELLLKQLLKGGVKIPETIVLSGKLNIRESSIKLK